MSTLYNKTVKVLNSTGGFSAAYDAYNVANVRLFRRGLSRLTVAREHPQTGLSLRLQFRNPTSSGMFRDFARTDRAPAISAAMVSGNNKLTGFEPSDGRLHEFWYAVLILRRAVGP